MEIMIVVILIGVIAAFAMPNYQKAIQKAHERDAILQLTAIQAANLVYRSAYTHFYIGTFSNAGDINTALRINIIAQDGMSYTYLSDGKTFTATAIWSAGNDTFSIQVNENPLSTTTAPLNPCCLAGTCLAITGGCR